MSKRRRARKRRLPELNWEVDLEMALRQSSAECNAELLSWLQHWRQHPDRVFWVVEADGRRRRLS